MNGAVRVQRYFERLVDRLSFSEPVERQQEQGLLNFEAHVVRRDVQTDEAVVNLFAFKERDDICRVVCNENEAFSIARRSIAQVLRRSHPKPRDVASIRGSHEPAPSWRARGSSIRNFTTPDKRPLPTSKVGCFTPSRTPAGIPWSSPAQHQMLSALSVKDRPAEGASREYLSQ
jgi:hypothetical protein